MVISDKFSPENLINNSINDIWEMVEGSPELKFSSYSAKKGKYTLSDQSAHIYECISIIDKYLAVGNPFVQINILMAYLYKLLDMRYILNCISDPIENFESYTENVFGCMIYDLIYEIRKNKFRTFNEVTAWIDDYIRKSKSKQKPRSPYTIPVVAIDSTKIEKKVAKSKEVVKAVVRRRTRSRAGGKTRRRKRLRTRRHKSKYTKRY